ncbi:MAG: HD domain-containing phosphohydrolase [Halanaerobiaceae bacterium]
MKQNIIESLRQQNYILHTVMDSLPNIIILLSDSGRIVYRNAAFEKLISKRKDCDVAGENYFELLETSELFPPKTAVKMKEAVRSVFNAEEKKKEVKFQCQISEKEKKYYCAQVSSYPGETLPYVVINQWEVKADENEKYELLLENIPEIVTWHNGVGELEYVNRFVESIPGLNREELLGEEETELPKTVLELWRKKLMEVSREQTEVEFEISLRHGREEKYYHTKLVPTVLNASSTAKILGITRDITEEVRSRNDLESKNALHRQLFVNAPFAVLLLDKNNRILKVNQAFKELFVFDGHELKNKNVVDLVIPEDKHREAEDICQLTFSGEEVSRETVRLTAEGEEVEVHLISYPVVLEENTLGRYVIYKDIRERKISERLYRRAQDKYLSEKEKEKEIVKEFNQAFVRSLVKLLELHDPYTAGHSHKVAVLSRDMADRMGLSKKKVEDAYWAGLVHDIGKVLVPKEILAKTGELNEDEYDQVKEHVSWGYQILEEFEQLENIARYVRYHHEHWDGTGYPDGLEGDQIPVVSAIIRIADIWQTLLEERAYRSAYTREEAFEEMKRGHSTEFSPQVFSIFEYMYNRGIF